MKPSHATLSQAADLWLHSLASQEAGGMFRATASMIANVAIERMIAEPETGAMLTLTQRMSAPYARIILEGSAGSGKSMSARRLALRHAASIAGNDQILRIFSDGTMNPACFPIWIDVASAPPCSSPDELLAHALRLMHVHAFYDAARTELMQGNAMIIIDGITPEWTPIVERFIDSHANNRFLCTCRPQRNATSSISHRLRERGFRAMKFVHLEAHEIDEIIARMLHAWLSDKEKREPLSERIAELCSSIRLHPDMWQIAHLPLALAIAVFIHTKIRPLPCSRPEVFQNALRSLWGEFKYHTNVIAPLAFSFHQAASDRLHGGEMSWQEMNRVVQISGIESESESAEILDHAFSIGLIAHANDAMHDLYCMPYDGLRAFLTAHSIASNSISMDALFQSCRPLSHWREVLALFTWMHATQHQRQAPAPEAPAPEAPAPEAPAPEAPAPEAPAPEAPAPEAPAPEAPAPEAPAPEAPAPIESAPIPWITNHIASLNGNDASGELAESILLLATSLLLSQPRVEEETIQAVDRMLIRVVECINTPCDLRVQAGELLGMYGDSRVAGMVPATVLVPGGGFIYGDNESPYPEERPARRVELPSFSIGKYPVTNAEYMRFLAANPKSPRPKYWHDPRFNRPSFPVVGVTLEEAIAYTAWLTYELRRSGLLPDGMVVRLPQEMEWEKAATWNAETQVKHRYPWGDQWIDDAANTMEARTDSKGISRWATTPVGCFPAGRSPCGAYDMIGNVWEWTISETHNRSEIFYVLRGASFTSQKTNARATYRGSALPPHFWRYNIGFRVVIARPLRQRRGVYRLKPSHWRLNSVVNNKRGPSSFDESER